MNAGDRFDAALRLRDSSRYPEALDELLIVIELATDGQPRLAAHAHMQRGNIYLSLDEPEEAERDFRVASQLLPRFELASLGLFHALFNREKYEEAFAEMLRFVTDVNSPEYHELLLSPGYGDVLPPKLRTIAEQSRRALAAHLHRN